MHHHASSTTGKKILVLVQLIGGNDGLNTLIPVQNYKNLVAARRNLFIPENKILPLNGTDALGLHPAFEGIRDMYNNDLISFVQGVGFGNPTFSHFRATDIWMTGSPSKVLDTGWMARFLETRYKNYPEGFPCKNFPDPPGIKIGQGGSFLFQGHAMDMSVIINPITGFQSPVVDIYGDGTESFADIEMKDISKVLIQTQHYAKTLTSASKAPFSHSRMYPKKGENALADQLQMVSTLINAGLQTSVYMVDLKGFDTHEGQADPKNSTKGAHADLLEKLSVAITAFWDDVQHMGKADEVTGMVFSEFGRRIISNASVGTDHGSSQPLMFFGGGINPGMIGKIPEIPDKATDDDNVAMQYDFRSVYASVLKNWLNAEPSHIPDILMGNFPEINIFR